MRRRPCGIALIGTLWVLVLLVLIATGSATALRNEARLARNLLAAAQARLAAEAGVQLALLNLAAPLAAPRWSADGTVHELRFGEATVRVALEDEAGKIDLNEAPPAVLRNLLGAAAAAQVVERRSRQPFALVEELGGLPGVPPTLYPQVRWALTVHSRQPRIIAEAASRQVLAAIPGVDERELDRYLALRARQRAAGLPPPAPPVDPRYLTRNGSATIGVRAEARLPGGATGRLAAVVDLRQPGFDRPFRLLDWRRESEALF